MVSGQLGQSDDLRVELVDTVVVTACFEDLDPLEGM